MLRQMLSEMIVQDNVMYQTTPWINTTDRGLKSKNNSDLLVRGKHIGSAVAELLAAVKMNNDESSRNQCWQSQVI